MFDSTWTPDSLQANAIHFFSLNNDKSLRAHSKEQLINVHASSFEPDNLAAALFYNRGEEVPCENMALLLQAYDDHLQDSNHPPSFWSLDQAKTWMQTQFNNKTLGNILQGGSISASSWTPMMRKLMARRFEWLDRQSISSTVPLPGISVRGLSTLPETDISSLIVPKNLSVIRVSSDQGRGYGLFLSYLLQRVYDAKAGNPNLPPVLYIIDEAQDIFSGSKQLVAACESMLDGNMRKGRSLHIAFWYGLQSFGALPGTIAQNLNSRITMRHKDLDGAKKALPNLDREIVALTANFNPGEAFIDLYGASSIIQATMRPSKARLTKD